MTVTDDARPHRERKPLPTKEQIEAIADIPALEAMQEELDRRAKKIEVDLEFEVGDDDWDGRARGALAAHRICLGQVSRRLGFLRSRAKPDRDTPGHIIAKAEKAKAKAEKQRALAEAARAAKENKQVALMRERLEFIDRISLHGFFMRAAAKMLDPDTFDQIMADANKRYSQAVQSHVPKPNVPPDPATESE